MKTIKLFLIMSVCALLFCACGNKVSGYFDEIEWGTAKEDVKTLLTEKEGIEPGENADGSKLQLEVENYRGVDGVKARIECSFKEEKLDGVFVYLDFDENAFKNEEIMSQYAEILIDEFGDCSQDTGDMKIWKLGKSEVQLANFSYGTLVIAYMPK